MAFASFEPSDAMIKAMQARLGAKGAVAAANAALPASAQAPASEAAASAIASTVTGSVSVAGGGSASVVVLKTSQAQPPALVLPKETNESAVFRVSTDPRPVAVAPATPSGAEALKLMMARDGVPAPAAAASSSSASAAAPTAAGAYKAAAAMPSATLLPGGLATPTAAMFTPTAELAGRALGAVAAASPTAAAAATGAGSPTRHACLPPRPAALSPSFSQEASGRGHASPPAGSVATTPMGELLSRPASGKRSQSEGCRQHPLTRGPRHHRAGSVASSDAGGRSAARPRPEWQSGGGPPSVLSQASGASPALDPMPKLLPSAVTVGGVPVAADGDMVYLGGGLFAAAVARPPEAKPVRKSRGKVLPGRVSMPPRPLGQRSAMRSASAHLLGPCPASPTGPLSPEPSRALSEGPLAAASSQPVKELPRAWRPGGVQKLPSQPPDPPAQYAGLRRAHSLFSADSVDLGAPGAMRSQVRAEARMEMARHGENLFGDKGMLAQLRAYEDAARREEASLQGQLPCRSAASVAGPPLSGELRAAERRAAKDERNRLLLEERQMRLAAEAEEAALKKKRIMAPLRGAPAPPSEPTASEPEDLEKQRLRLACKMEIMDFFKGYSKAIGNMTAEQTRQLLMHLNSVSPAPARPCGSDEASGEEDAWEGVAHQSVEERLQEAHQMGNSVFDASHGDALDL